MQVKLPSLPAYRNIFVESGITLPLPAVVNEEKGLLEELPENSSPKTGWPWLEQTDPKLYDNSTDWPKITIVTPSFNQGRFIEATIRSVLLQNYPNLEYIIMDGGSTDETQEIIKKYERWVSYWQTEKDNGQGQAINQGFSISSGKIHSWINSDDYYLPGVLAKIAKCFKEKRVDFVYGYGFNYHLSACRFELVKILPHIDYFIKMPTLIQPSTFWRAAIHQPIWEDLHCSMDFELWLRLLKGQRRLLIKEPLSVATVHEDAKTFNPIMKEKWEEDHHKIWSEEAHGRVNEWNKLVLLNRIRVKLFKILKWI